MSAEVIIGQALFLRKHILLDHWNEGNTQTVKHPLSIAQSLYDQMRTHNVIPQYSQKGFLVSNNSSQ